MRRRRAATPFTRQALGRCRAFAPGLAGSAELVVQTRLRPLVSRLRRPRA